jgi:F-type H+-transporting ATPase subunit b
MTTRTTRGIGWLVAVALVALPAVAMAATPSLPAEPANPLAAAPARATPAPAAPAAAARAPTPAAAPAEPEEQPGLLSPQVSTAMWEVFMFLVVAAVLYKTAWPNVLAGLNARQTRITRDIADAEAARVKAEASVVEYNKQLATAESQVRELLNKAATDAERIGASIRAKAQQEADEAKDRALKEIEASRRAAIADIYEQTANLATSVAEKILRRAINADDQKALVEQSLKQMQTAGA